MRQPKPFYKQSHKAWYVEHNGKQVCLVKGDKSETLDEAYREYHRRMAGELPTTSKTTVAEIVAQYLSWVEKNRAPATHEWYAKYLETSPKTSKVRRSFLDYIGDRKLVSDLKPNHVQRWLDDRYEGVSDNYKNCAARAVATCFNWAADLQILPGNPVKGFKRPAPQARECYLTPDQWKRLIGAVDGPFADFLWFLHETGARPQEARIVAATHFDKAGRRLVLERKNSKGKRVRRVIRLNDRALEIVTEECQADSGVHLKQLLTEDHRFVFTLIQKFGTRKGEKYPKLSDRSDIIVMTDEAHRSQYDTPRPSRARFRDFDK